MTDPENFDNSFLVTNRSLFLLAPALGVISFLLFPQPQPLDRAIYDCCVGLLTLVLRTSEQEKSLRSPLATRQAGIVCAHGTVYYVRYPWVRFMG